MTEQFTEGASFENTDFTTQDITGREYENCRFINCLFSEADLTGVKFIDCEFDDCDLSLAGLSNTAFSEVAFKNCKLLGLHFEDCHPLLFAVSFEQCQLNMSSFYQRAMTQTIFQSCSLQEVDFTEADLTESVFFECSLAGAIFDHTILEAADLRTARHFSIDPEKNTIRRARLSREGLAGLLGKYDLEIE